MISSSKLRFASLGSGSQGNATLVSCGSTLILVDCGFSMKETCIRLAKLGVEAEQLTAILITHEHQDHLKGAGALARRYKLPVYSTHGTRFTQRLGKLADWRPINPEHPFAVEDIEVRPVTVPHDAREPVQFVLSNGAKRLGLLTDLGSITPHLLKQYNRLDGLILEANHCPELLAMGSYPPSVKRRIGGLYGHLSNQQAQNFLQQVDTSRLQHLIAAHLSEENNLPSLAVEHLAAGVSSEVSWIGLANQSEGLAWREIIS